MSDLNRDLLTSVGPGTIPPLLHSPGPVGSWTCGVLDLWGPGQSCAVFGCSLCLVQSGHWVHLSHGTLLKPRTFLHEKVSWASLTMSCRCCRGKLPSCSLGNRKSRSESLRAGSIRDCEGDPVPGYPPIPGGGQASLDFFGLWKHHSQPVPSPPHAAVPSCVSVLIYYLWRHQSCWIRAYPALV